MNAQEFVSLSRDVTIWGAVIYVVVTSTRDVLRDRESTRLAKAKMDAELKTKQLEQEPLIASLGILKDSVQNLLTSLTSNVQELSRDIRDFIAFQRGKS